MRLRAVQSVGVMCGVVVVVVGVSVRELLSGHDFANFGWGFGDNCWMVLLIVWWLLGGSEHFFCWRRVGVQIAGYRIELLRKI